jgi:hypothetical protein
MLIFKVKIKQKLNSEPEITRKNEILPCTENSGSSEYREKSVGVGRMKFLGGKVGVQDCIGGRRYNSIWRVSRMLRVTFKKKTNLKL